ncbi:MAG TPA: universal stress protein [Candidatus Methanoperedenaceae archaeon]|nr:universal stress protein [Candidatus Methanoperedenaceae archaeon]
MSDFLEIKKILVPLDGSVISESALKYGASIASKYGAEVVILSVYSPKKQGSILERLIEMDPTVGDDLRRMSPVFLLETYHDVMIKTLKKYNVSGKSILKDASTTTKSIVGIIQEVVIEEAINLIVLTSHGKTGFQKLRLGSVTEELITESLVPVLLVK